MLTQQMAKLLAYIDGYQRRTDGVCPSFDEMREAMGLQSKSGVHRMVEALEERGYVRRLKHRHRAIEVIRKPQ